MKILITESQLSIILERSKEKILIDKIGLSPEVASILNQLCGSHSVWMANKLIDFIKKNNYTDNKELIIKKVNDLFYSRTTNNITTEITNIMDYVRVGLNGNISTIKELTFSQLGFQADVWHQSLKGGTSKLDYKEREEFIILDYRDENGFGYYWVDLKKKQCSEESERMGHCGRSEGNLYSLRQYIPVQKRHTLNKSLLTASINEKGNLLQLKGPYNSKPDKKYHLYILDLFKLVKNGENLIKSVGGDEYDPNSDFKLEDLDDDNLKQLYSYRKDLFTGRLLRKRLYDLGLISKEEIIITTITIPYNHLKYIISDSSIAGKTKVFEYNEDDFDIFRIIDDSEFWDFWNNNTTFLYEYNDSIKYIDKNNYELIWQIIRTMSNDNISEYRDLEYVIEEYDKNNRIKNKIATAYSLTIGINFQVSIMNKIEDFLEKNFGETTIMDSNVEIQLNPKLGTGVAAPLWNILEYCDNENSCVLKSLRLDRISEKNRPKIIMDIDSLYNSTVNNFDRAMFNRLLSDKLNKR